MNTTRMQIYCHKNVLNNFIRKIFTFQKKILTLGVWGIWIRKATLMFQLMK